MPCERTITAYQPARGGPVRFNQPRDGRAYNKIELPCGHCILCRLEHARQWAVRITHEAQLHLQSSFVTLTYDDAHLPAHNSLHYPDLQKFWKRLRKTHAPIRYYAVGEYGDITNRPHYHACIFGHAFIKNRVILKTEPYLLWTNQELTETWGLGHVSVGALTFQTAQYTASYVTKKLNAKRQYVRIDETTGELVPLVQPRAFMSLKPAIGRDWLDEHGEHTYDHDHVVINGRPQKPPKYYDRWLEQTNTTHFKKVKEKRRSKATKLTEDQTRARARNAHARAKTKTKSV